jgi:GAF domain-containing protein
MMLFDEPESPRWKLLTVAEERLDGALSREAVIELVRATARSVLDADGVTFILREGDLCHYLDEDAISPLWKGRRFPISACVSGWSLCGAQTVVIEDIAKDSRIPQDAYRAGFAKSLIMTQVADAPPVAAIGAYWRERRHFTDREIMAIKTLSVAVGRALADHL